MDNAQRRVCDTAALAISSIHPADDRGEFVQEAVTLYIERLKAFRPDLTGAEVSANAANLCQSIIARFDEMACSGGDVTAGNA